MPALGKIIVQEDIFTNDGGRIPQRTVCDYYLHEEATATHVLFEDVISPYTCYYVYYDESYYYIWEELCIPWDESMESTHEERNIEKIIEDERMDNTKNVDPLYLKMFGINRKDTYRPQYEGERYISKEKEDPGEDDNVIEEVGPWI